MSDSQITLYQDSDYRGTSRTLGIGRYATGFGLSSDSLSSIRIPSGLRVILCEHANFQGRRCILVRDTPGLGSANDAVSSIIVEPIGEPKVIVYSDSDFRGWSAEVPVGSQAVIGAGTDLVSSVLVPSGLKVSLCEHENLQGRRCILVRDTPRLGDANDRASSILVEPIGEPKVIVYGDSNFSGWSAEVPVGRQAAIGAGGDLVSSVIVPPGHRVTLYEDTDFRGGTRELTSDAASLGSFSDKASSIIVDRPTGRVPTLNELKQIIQNVGPRIYFHPDEAFLPSSVEWFLQRASLYSSSGNPRRADSEPLPSGGGDDGAFWLVGSTESRSGELGSAVAYVNAKLQNNWLDIQFWIFYPYNGAGRAYVRVFGANSLSKTVNLAPMGQHGGDWEHATCRVYPDTFELRAMYLAQHSGGEWVAMGDIPRENGRPVVYSSRNGHASYRGEGSNLSDGDSQSIEGVKLWEIGLLNETEKSSKVLDCNSKYRILRADFLNSGITAPQWLEYCRRWGPRITYSTNELKGGISDQLSGIPYSSDIVDAIWNKIPDEAKEENGPTGPWRKGSWSDGE